MKNKKKTIAVLYGGKGVEHDVSKLGGKFVLSLLERESFNVLPIFIDRSGEWFLIGKKRYSVSPEMHNGVGGIIKKRRFVPIDAAFPMLHGDFGEDGRIQGLLESLGIPFVGCDTLSGAVCADKNFTKSVVKELGIPTLAWCSSSGFSPEEFLRICEENIGYPMFVKPTRLGSSVGAGIARDKDELKLRISLAYEVGNGKIIAEKYMENPRELECAFLELFGKKYITPPGEILLTRGFYGYSEKYGENSPAEVITKSDADDKITEKLRTYTDMITRALGVRSLARVDYFLLGEEIYFNEINTMPGMTASSLYPKMIDALGITPCRLINGLVRDVLGDQI